jgi:hypothetical protein
MGLGSGMFNIIRQGQHSAGAMMRPQAGFAGSTGSNPQSWTLKRHESAVDALWRLAPEQASRAKMLTPSTMQKLQKLADSDNKDISAEKMRQAKAKLEGLRRQLQMLAATGDVRQLRRIAAEAASLAREIGAAARALGQSIGAQGIGSGQAQSSTEASSDGGAQAIANAANGAAQSAPEESRAEGADAAAASATQAENTADAATGETGTAASASPLAQSFKELKELSDDARNAIVQAKGIIAMAAQMARAKRKAAEDDDDRYFRDLQEQADAALSEVDRGQREATSLLIAEGGAASVESMTESTIESTTTITSVTIETSITALVMTQPQVDVFA